MFQAAAPKGQERLDAVNVDGSQPPICGIQWSSTAPQRTSLFTDIEVPERFHAEFLYLPLTLVNSFLQP